MKKNIIGFGTYPNKENLIELIPSAINNGFTMLDTSDDYFNEEYIGKINCENIKIFTKYSICSNVLSVDNKFDLSSKKLNNNKIYAYLLHWPYPFLYKKIWKKMERLYLEGRVERIGVCNFDEKHLSKLLKKCKIKPMYNEIELHPLFQQKKLVDFCVKNDIQIISYSPFARMDNELFQNPELNRIALKYNTSVANIILCWNLKKGFIPIPSSSKIKHIDDMCFENIDSIELSKEEIGIIDLLDKGKRIRFNPNTYFSFKTKIKLFFYLIFKKI